ncbi:hypothetical protein VE04_03603 [Pseudogymnoascus sp. 24MN13]|nr:hypothetical protein VE04_03603 [Pseudogymnoascus sp. 24MN13]
MAYSTPEKERQPMLHRGSPSCNESPEGLSSLAFASENIIVTAFAQHVDRDGSHIPELSRSPSEVASLKPNPGLPKRKSHEDMCGGTIKKSRFDELTIQVRKSELDGGKINPDVAVSVSSAAAPTSTFKEVDGDRRIEDGMAGETTRSRFRSDDGEQDTISVEEDDDSDKRTNIVPLHCREVDIEYTYDTELFPWKRSISRPRVVLGGIKYVEHKVIIPEDEILSVQTDLYHEPGLSSKGFVDYGEGLLIKDGVWYDDIEDNEESSLVATEDDQVLDGDDGELYRKSIGCLRLYYVGLRREVVSIGTVRYIEHLVLTEKYSLHADVLPVGFSPDGTEIVSPSHYNNTLNIWDTDTCFVRLTLEGHTGRVFSGTFSPDGTKIASASADTTLNIWDRDTGTLLRTLEGHTGGVFSVSFSPDGTMIASASYDNTRNIWYTDTGALLRTLKGYTAGVVSVAFSPDSTQLAEASADKKLNIWDTRTGALLQTLQGHTAGVSSVAFSPDGTKIASASYDTTLNIWDTNTGDVLWTLEGRTDKVRSLVFSPDSKLLALASHKAMWLWDYTKYATPRTLRDNSGQPVEVETLTFSPDGKELMSASLDMDMWRWDTITGLLLPWKNLISPTAMAKSPAASSLPTIPATEEPEKMWKAVGISLAVMNPGQPIPNDENWKLVARYIQPGSKRALPGIDFIAGQNKNKGPDETGAVPLQQMERLLSGIPDAQAVAFFILSYLPEEHHTLLSCTTIFIEEHTPVWRGHVLFEEWSEGESGAFVSEFSRLVHESQDMKSVLRKWSELLKG